MNKSIVLILLVFCLAALAAQEIDPYLFLRHSARCPDGNLKVRWEDASGNFLGTQCLYSTNSGPWQEAPVEQFSGTQLQALVPYEYGHLLRYRLRTEISYMEQQFVLMHAPYLNGDSFPPALNSLGLIGADATGDSVMVYESVLDFTNSWCGATADKIYATLANVPGIFPTMNSLTSYNVWGTVIANPESVADTLAYAMLYTFSIPGVISPGLYKVQIDDTGMPAFARIGDIQSQVQGGRLYLACDLADLTSDPDFGPWPSQYRGLGFSSLSMQASYNLSTNEIDFGIGDYSTPAAVFFLDHAYDFAANSLPVADNLYLETGSNTIHFDYLDANGDFPLQADFVIAGGPTVALQPQGYDFSQGVHFSGSLPYAPTAGQLLLSDNGIDVVQFDWDGTAAPSEALVPAALDCRMANPLRLGGAPFRIGLSGLEKGFLRVGLYNLRGENLGLIYSGAADSGELELAWDGLRAGRALPSGIYLLRAEQGGRSLARKFVLAK